MKKQKLRRGRIIYEGLVPDTDPIYERGWTILTGRNLSRNLPEMNRMNQTVMKKQQIKAGRRLTEAHQHALKTGFIGMTVVSP